MEINNFKELERQEIAELGSPPATIRKKISHNIGLFRFIGDLVELYLPNAGKSIIGMTTGDRKSVSSDHLDERYPNKETN